MPGKGCWLPLALLCADDVPNLQLQETKNKTPSIELPCEPSRVDRLSCSEETHRAHVDVTSCTAWATARIAADDYLASKCIGGKCGGMTENDGYTKFLDAETFVPANLERLKAAGLFEEDGRVRRVLDIGSGPGYFVSMARLAGHVAMAMDVPPCRIGTDEGGVVMSKLSNALDVYPIPHASNHLCPCRDWETSRAASTLPRCG